MILSDREGVAMPYAFERPAFYMPFTARVNPDLEAAREHTRAWARGVGVGLFDRDGSGSVAWSEEIFDRADFAHFTALAYPDAPAPELDLVTDWHAWIWFVDDTSLPGLREVDGRAEVHRRISRLMAFCRRCRS